MINDIIIIIIIAAKIGDKWIISMVNSITNANVDANLMLYPGIRRLKTARWRRLAPPSGLCGQLLRLCGRLPPSCCHVSIVPKRHGHVFIQVSDRKSLRDAFLLSCVSAETLNPHPPPGGSTRIEGVLCHGRKWWCVISYVIVHRDTNSDLVGYWS